jgi:hypothetical protein
LAGASDDDGHDIKESIGEQSNSDIDDDDTVGDLQGTELLAKRLLAAS